MDRQLKDFAGQVVAIMPLILREFMRREKNPLTRGSISFPQMIALHVLLHRTHLQMKELARLLSIRMSSATVLVDRLVRESMVRRTREESDRRAVWIRLSTKGRRVIRQILEEKKRSIGHIFGVLSREEQRQYLSLLKKVQSYLSRKP